MLRNLLCCALSAVTSVVLGAPLDGTDSGAGTDSYLRYAGSASVRHSTQFLYGEQHVLHYHAGLLTERVVLYTCHDGSAFARKSVRYVDPLAPDFLLENADSGMREGIRSGPADRIVFFRLRAADTEKSAVLPRLNGLVADAGFDEFVRANWQRLIGADALAMPFVVPSRLQVYGFQVQHLRSETLDGVASEVFRLRLAGLWGWLLRGIDVYYSSAGHLLVRYDGLSDLRDGAGDPFRVEIAFPAAARRAASEADLRAAREVALHRCH